MLMRSVHMVTLLIALFFAFPIGAHSAVIVSPVSTTASSTHAQFPIYSVNNTINHSGLLTPFISGVTDFDANLAGDPRHEAGATEEMSVNTIAPYGDNEWLKSVSDAIRRFPLRGFTFPNRSIDTHLLGIQRNYSGDMIVLPHSITSGRDRAHGFYDKE